MGDKAWRPPPRAPTKPLTKLNHRCDTACLNIVNVVNHHHRRRLLWWPAWRSSCSGMSTSARYGCFGPAHGLDRELTPSLGQTGSQHPRHAATSRRRLAGRHVRRSPKSPCETGAGTRKTRPARIFESEQGGFRRTTDLKTHKPCSPAEVRGTGPASRLPSGTGGLKGPFSPCRVMDPALRPSPQEPPDGIPRPKPHRPGPRTTRPVRANRPAADAHSPEFLASALRGGRAPFRPRRSPLPPARRLCRRVRSWRWAARTTRSPRWRHPPRTTIA